MTDQKKGRPLNPHNISKIRFEEAKKRKKYSNPHLIRNLNRLPIEKNPHPIAKRTLYENLKTESMDPITLASICSVLDVSNDYISGKSSECVSDYEKLDPGNLYLLDLKKYKRQNRIDSKGYIIKEFNENKCKVSQDLEKEDQYLYDLLKDYIIHRLVAHELYVNKDRDKYLHLQFDKSLIFDEDDEEGIYIKPDVYNKIQKEIDNVLEKVINEEIENRETQLNLEDQQINIIED